MFTTPINTNEQSIDRVLAAGLPVLLVFWSKDNSVSRQLEPTLNSLASAYAGRALIARVDAKDNPNLVHRYNIAQLPGLIFVKEGKLVAQSSGAAPEAALHAWLEYLTSGGERPPLPGGANTPPSGAATHNSAPQGERARVNSSPSTQGSASGAMPTVLSDATFDKAISGTTQPVLVDFWAPWCGPCRMVAPTVERLAQEFAGRAVVAKLNVDDNPRVAQRFGISSIPALYIFKNGKVVERLVGAQPASALRQVLARHAGS